MIGEQIFINIMLKLLGNAQVQKELIKVTNSVNNLTVAEKKNTETAKGVTLESKKVTTSMNKQGTATKKLTSKWTTLSAVVDKDGFVLKKVEARMGKLRYASGQLSKATVRQTRTWVAHGNKMKTQTSGLNSLLSGFTKVRWAMVNVALIAMTLKTIYTKLIKPIVDLETEMATVQKRTKMTDAQIKSLEGEFISLSRAVPDSADALAKLGGIAGQLGIRGVENIVEFARVTNMMGNSTVMTSEEAALSLAKLSQAYDIPISKIENMASVIDDLSNTTAANSKEISASMLKMAAAGHQLGVPLETTAAIGATLVDMGMKAERAGTRMRSVFTKLATSSEKIASIFGDRLPSQVKKGIAEDATGSFLELLRKINEAESSTDRVAMATEIFGKVGAGAVLGLASNYTQLERSIVRATDQFKNATALQDEFDIAMSTTANQMSIMWGQIGASITDFFRASNTAFGQALLKSNTLALSYRKIAEAQKEMGDRSVVLDFNLSTGSSMDTKKQLLDIAEMSSSYEEFAARIDKRRKLFNNGVGISKGQELELKFTYDLNKSGMDEAVKNLKAALIKVEDDKLVKITNAGAAVEIEKLAALRVKFTNIDLKNINEKKDAELELGAAEKELSKYGTIIADDITKQSVTRANSVLGIHENADAISKLTEDSADYTASLDALQETAATTNMTNAEYIESLRELQEEYKDVIRLGEIRKLGLDSLASSIKSTTDAQKVASFVYGIANKQYTEQINDLQSDYNQYAKAKFKGEQEELNNIHALELAIQKQKLAQLELGDAVAATNDELNENSYDAWVTTVHEFIRAAIEQGNLLGENVSAAVAGFQTSLLSTSKFGDDTESSEEMTALEELEREREIAQAKYDIGMGEQHYQLQQSIAALETQGQREFDNATSAYTALKKKGTQIDKLKAKQEKLTKEWEDTQEEITRTEFILSGAVDANVLAIGKEKTAVYELIAAYRLKSAVSAGSVKTIHSDNGNVNLIDTPNERDGASKITKADGSVVYRTIEEEFANGGIIDKPTVALMGEAGPEMVVPLTGPNAGAGLGSVTIGNINITGVEGDASDFAYAFSEELRRQLKTQ